MPGACLGGWAWREVTARLRALDHEVFPVTLTGLGERAHLANRDLDLSTHIADVVNLLDCEDLHDVVLVGHSYAGIVITGVADQRPERLATVVYLDSSPIPGGMAIKDFQTQEQQERERERVQKEGAGWLWPVPDRKTLLAGVYGSASGLQPSHLQLIEARATAQPYATFTSPLLLNGPEDHELRRVAIFCGDGGMSLGLLRDLVVQRDPRAAIFADGGWELHELPTGHWAMFSLPGPLAELVHRVASTPGGSTSTT